MRAKSVLLLVLALGCGLIASIGISQVMDRKGPAPVEEEKVDVFVAKVDIPKAELIKPDMVKIQQWPKTMVPDDAITKLEQIENKQAHEKILANELIREARFIKTDKKLHIPPGFRVVTVKVNAEKGGHLVSVGDKVDLQVYLRQGSTSQIVESTTRTFLRDVKVFAVGTETQKQDGEQVGNSAQTVSLLVRPREAELVTLAQRMGEVSIVMKNASDTSVASDEKTGVGAKDLLREMGWDLGGDAKPSTLGSAIANKLKNVTSPRKTANSFQMTAYVGGDVIQYAFDDAKKSPVSMTSGNTRQSDGPPAFSPVPTDEPETKTDSAGAKGDPLTGAKGEGKQPQPPQTDTDKPQKSPEPKEKNQL